MAFVTNNIKYRSTTAKALEWYYNTKAFILNELSDSRNDFSKGARELLLMLLNNYKEWTDFTEQYLLDKKIVAPQDVDVIVANLQKIESVNMTVFDIHTEVFPPELLRVWKSAGATVRSFLYHKIQKAKGMDHLEAYPYLINCLLSSLQSTLYQLYEIDSLLGCELLKSNTNVTTNRSNPNRLVLLIDDNDIQAIAELGVFDPLERLQIYIQLVDKNSPVVIKNLSSQDATFLSSTGELIGNSVLTQHLLPIVSDFNVVEIMGTKS